MSQTDGGKFHLDTDAAGVDVVYVETEDGVLLKPADEVELA